MLIIIMHAYAVLSAVLLIQACSCLTTDEISMFRARVGRESNSKLQGFVDITESQDGTTLIFKSNGIPDHKTGPRSRNLKVQSYSISIPRNPSIASSSTCLPDGLVGIALNGVPIYNPYTERCCDSGTAEANLLDVCWGKVDQSGRYQYTTPPFCIQKTICNESLLIGVALDGYPIYGPYDELGKELSSSDLDACHGRGDRFRNYRYHLTTDFPYVIGCFMGIPSPNQVSPSAACKCANLVDPCPEEGAPPMPVTPPSRKRRDIQQSKPVLNADIQCCADADTCAYTFNLDAPSSSSSARSYGFASLLFMQVLLYFMLHVQQS